jgi:hypothetical protein
LAILTANHRASSRGTLFFRWSRFRRLFPSPRRQTADEHKRDQDNSKDSQFETIHHAGSPSSPQLSRLAEFVGLGMSFNICRGTLGSLAMITAMKNASSLRSIHANEE